jgi:hypothetical protein
MLRRSSERRLSELLQYTKIAQAVRLLCLTTEENRVSLRGYDHLLRRSAMPHSEISHQTMTLLDLAGRSNRQEVGRSIADDAPSGVADDSIGVSVADDARGMSVADDAPLFP